MTGEEVRAAAERWRAFRAGNNPDNPVEDYGRRFSTERSCQADRDSTTLADAVLAWWDRYDAMDALSPPGCAGRFELTTNLLDQPIPEAAPAEKGFP